MEGIMKIELTDEWEIVESVLIEQLDAAAKNPNTWDAQLNWVPVIRGDLIRKLGWANNVDTAQWPQVHYKRILRLARKLARARGMRIVIDKTKYYSWAVPV